MIRCNCSAILYAVYITVREFGTASRLPKPAVYSLRRPYGAVPFNQEKLRAMLKRNKSDTVAALQRDDHERAKVLTQEKQVLKKRIKNQCAVCGVVCSGARCSTHRLMVGSHRRLSTIKWIG